MTADDNPWPKPDEKATLFPARVDIIPPQEVGRANSQLPDGRLLWEIDFDLIKEWFKTHTTAQATRLVEPYIGQWTRLTGPLGDFSGHQITFDHVRSPVSDYTIYMYTTDEDSARYLSLLKRGQMITVIGQIKRIHRVTMDLMNCEIWEARPS